MPEHSLFGCRQNKSGYYPYQTNSSLMRQKRQINYNSTIPSCAFLSEQKMKPLGKRFAEEKQEQARAISCRKRGQGDLGAMGISQFSEILKKELEQHFT